MTHELEWSPRNCFERRDFRFLLALYIICSAVNVRDIIAAAITTTAHITFLILLSISKQKFEATLRT